jgi:pyruvate,orthophosphate dikinase
MSADAARLVFDFAAGSREQVDLLGGKGANLAEMTRLGLPVPPGFTITTDACRHYLDRGEEPQSLRIQVTMALRRLEDQLGRRLGDVQDPLLVSVRSGAKFSMPGMMETVLNVGLNDYSVKGLAEAAQDESLRLGLLPPPAADVRPHRARHPRRAVRDGRRIATNARDA